jgi:predicted MFS family arabinose efflux permease
MLAVRDGRLFLAAQALDSIAIGVSLVALPWLILQNGGSQAQAGLVYSFTIVPYVVFGLSAGSIGDRLPPRTVMVSGHVAQALCAAVIPLWTIAGAPPVAVVYAAGFAVGTGRVFVDAAAFGAVASIVGTERFTEGQSALSAAWSIGLFAGPALGGALVAAVGPGGTLAAEALALALAALAISLIRVSFGHRDEPGGKGAVREGVRFMLRDRGVLTYTVIAIVASLAGAGAFALLVPLMRDEIGLSSGEVGAIMAISSVATLSASMAAPAISRRFGGNGVIAACLLVSPFTIAFLGIAGGFAGALLGVFAYFLILGVYSVVMIGERQRRAPERLQARVGIAGRMILLGAITSGAALASALTGPLGISHVYLAMAAGTLIVGVCATPFVLRLDD